MATAGNGVTVVEVLLAWCQLWTDARPSLLCVGYSRSLKKTKTPPLPKSEKPGKIPWSKSLRAGFLGRSKAPWRWVSAQGSCSCHPLIHSLIQSFSRNLFSTYVPGCGESLWENSNKFLLPWSLRAREEECRQQIKTSEEDGCCKENKAERCHRQKNWQGGERTP